MKKNYDLKKMKRKKTSKTYPEASKVAVNIRLDAITVDHLKDEAERMGLPYQTLINSILHRFVTGELVDKGRKSDRTG
jgi:predicted DNA binding CopG/RHH family protein